MKSFIEKLILVACVVVGLAGGSSPDIPDGNLTDFPVDETLLLEIVLETDDEIRVFYRCYCNVDTHDSSDFLTNLPDGFKKGPKWQLLLDELVVYSKPPAGRPAVINVDGTPCQYIATIDSSESQTIPNSQLIGTAVQRGTVSTFKAGSLVHILTSVYGDVFVLGGVMLSFLEENDAIIDDIGLILENRHFPSVLTYSTKVLSQDLVQNSGGLAMVLMDNGMAWEAIDVEDKDDL
mmetsp:Transcript_23257/g.54992  ORF Transcript_23257/g.54992 Transcript_23257/m.54992 type:complete len:235 (+) Transcript_23257:121-825(+)